MRITALSLLFLFVALQAFGTQPELTQVLDLCGPTFNALVPGQKVDRSSVYDLLKSKFEMRLLGEGGPIGQPGFFAGIRPESETIKRLRQTHGEAVEDESVNTSLVGNHRTLGIHEIGKRIDDGSIALPLVMKPNRNAHGKNIVFLERYGDLVTITMAHAGVDSFHKFEGTTRVINELKQMGISDVQIDGRQQITKATFNPAKQPVSEVLRRVWDTLATEEHFVSDGTRKGFSYGSYDAGMVESMLDPYRYKGRAYETRHKFNAQFDQGVTSLVKTKDDGHSWNLQTPGSFARIGTSPYFSNQTGRSSAEKMLLPAAEMYDPLFEEFKITGDQKEAFAQHIDGLVRAQVAHYFKRLGESGVRLDEKLSGQIDLMWLPPDKPGGFPKPIIIEAYITSDSALSQDPITITEPGNFSSKPRTPK